MSKCTLKNGKIIGDFKKPYFVAEMNSSHNGKIELAKEMIDRAIDAGCDAVKFQSWTANSLYSKNYYRENPIAYRMVSRFALSKNQLKELSIYCKKRKIDFSSTPYSKEELDFLVDECEAPFVKVASMDINNLKFLEQIAKKQVAIILSTGMASMDEIKKAVDTIQMAGNSNICLLHCVSIYPVDESQINLNNMREIRHEFVDIPVGYSDHTIGNIASICAVANGAALIEKHFTLDNKKIGWDNQMACEPNNFKEMIQLCNKAYGTMGNASREVSQEEIEQAKKMRRSIVAGRDIPEGTVIKEEMLEAKRPYIGISPDKMNILVGKKAKRDIEMDEIIFLTDVE